MISRTYFFSFSLLQKLQTKCNVRGSVHRNNILVHNSN